MQVHEEEFNLTQQEFDMAIAYARTYGKNLERQVPSRENSAATQNAIILRDDGGKIIYRFPKRLFAMTTSKTDKVKAIAWARSLGYPVPSEPNGCLSILLIAIGACIFILPGLIILIWVAHQAQVYQRDIDALVARWVDAGKPDPGIKANVGTKLGMINEVNTATTQLEEYAKLLERGLISPEEHEVLRKKALGL